jgi:hypothetical protein
VKFKLGQDYIRPNILNVKDKIGAKINNHLFEVVGYIVSLKINLTPSANGCNKPNIPILFGPKRLCIDNPHIKDVRKGFFLPNHLWCFVIT